MLNKSTCQRHVNQAAGQSDPSLTLKKPLLVFDLEVKAAKSENEKRLFNVRKGSDQQPGKSILFTRPPGE